MGDTLIGGPENDTIVGGDGDDEISGGSGLDLLVGGAGADTLRGDAGFDIVSYNQVFDNNENLIYAGSPSAVNVRLDLGTSSGGDAEGDEFQGIEGLIGSDFGDTLASAAGVDSSLEGAGGADWLIGNSGNDTLLGQDGNDTLEGGGGNDSLDGGAGENTITYSSSTAGVNARLYQDISRGSATGTDTLRNFTDAIGTNFDDTLIGSAGGVANELVGLDGADFINGGGGDDTLDGGEGDDTLIGSGGADSLLGGQGFDIADYSGSASGVNVRLYQNLAIGAQATGDVLIDIEGMIGTNFNDTLVGSAGRIANELVGLDGADFINGGGGDDTLDGGEGDDTLIGSGGADSLLGGQGFDIADYSGSASGVNVRLYQNLAIGAQATGDVLVDIEGMIGTNFDDTLIGSAGRIANELSGLDGADFLNGGGGDDTLDGGDGNDTLRGSGGADSLDGGSGFDVVDYSGAGNGVNVRLYQSLALGGEANGDTIVNVEGVIGSSFDDTLIGSLGGIADELCGGAGADSLNGGGGNDTLDGGSGSDLLRGGGGSDVFVEVSDGANDVIFDFDVTSDTILLSGYGTDFDTDAEVLAAATQVGGDVVIDFGSETLTLQGVSIGSLSGDDFDFV